MLLGKPSYEMMESHPDWAPSLHLGHGEVTERFARRTNRNWQVSESPDGTAQGEAAPLEDNGEESAGKTETEKMAACNSCESLCAEVNRLMEENRALRRELEKRTMDEEFLKDDPEKINYYTGLPNFEVLKAMLASVDAFLPQAALSPFQMLFLTLMYLRLNLPVQHIAHLFHVDIKTVSKTFSDTMGVLNAQISPLIHWPERDALLVSMPHKFTEAFGERAAVILECFEIITEGVSNIKEQAQVYSHLKRNTTMKYLVGVTPQGSVSFVSQAWEGRFSDKYITENCGILEQLSPGDLVLADRGFDIKNSVGLMCAEVKISAGGRCHLDIRDVEETQKIAHLRIHVERVIDSIRNNYPRLAGKAPFCMELPCDMTLLDKTVLVCCALTNM